MDYGKAVSIIRTAKGLSQKDFANAIGKTPSYVSRIEKNERTPSSDLINLICERMGIPVSLFRLLGKKYKNMDDKDRKLLDELGAELLRIITED